MYAVTGPQHEAQIRPDERKVVRMHVVLGIVQDVRHGLYIVVTRVGAFNFKGLVTPLLFFHISPWV